MSKTYETENFTVGIEGPDYAWFEHLRLGDEYGGGIWIENGAVVDYDGIADWLPEEICDQLKELGIDASEADGRNFE